MANKVRKLQKRREELAELTQAAKSAPPANPSRTAPSTPGGARTRELEFVAERRLCDDELTVVSSRLKPWQQRFAALYAEGSTLEESMRGSGFQGNRPIQGGWDLLRRNADVRRYIHLARQRATVASTITLAALQELLWLQARDPSLSHSQRDKAIAHLVKIMTPPPAPHPSQGDEPKPGTFRAKEDLEAELDKVLEDFKARRGT